MKSCFPEVTPAVAYLHGYKDGTADILSKAGDYCDNLKPHYASGYDTAQFVVARPRLGFLMPDHETTN